MRVPWPFARAQRATPTVGGPSASAVQAEPTAARLPVGVRPAWLDLPPTQRVVGPPVLTSDRRAFDAARAGSHTLSPVLADITAAPALGPVLSTRGAVRPSPAPRVWAGGTSQPALGRPTGRGGAERDRGEGEWTTQDMEALPVAPALSGASQATPAVARTTATAASNVASGSAPVTGQTGAAARSSAVISSPARVSSASNASSGDRPMTALAPTQREAIERAVASHGRLDLVRRQRPAAAAAGAPAALVSEMNAVASPGTAAIVASATSAASKAPSRRRAGLGPPIERPDMGPPASTEALPRTAVGDGPVAAGAPLIMAGHSPARSAWIPRRRAAATSSRPPSATVPSSADGQAHPAWSPATTVMPPIVARRPGRSVQRAAADAATTPDQVPGLALERPAPGRTPTSCAPWTVR